MKYVKKYIIFSVLCLASVGSLAQDAAKLSFSVEELSPGLYMLKGVGGFTGGNIALSVGEDGVVMVDDSMPPMLGILKDAIKSVTPKPVDFLVSTHIHGDHMGNNQAFGEQGTHIVAHENFRKRLLSQGIQTQQGMKEAPKSALPVISFNDHVTFHLNGEDVKTFHVANAHTDGDAIVYFKNSNVIHTGDVFFNNMFPYIDINNGGSVDGYIAAQTKILNMADEATKIIPGHGALATKKDLMKDVEVLKDAKKLILALIKQGKSEEDVVKNNPLAPYHEEYNWGFITTERMTRQVYKSLKNDAKGSHHSHSKGHYHSHSH